MTDDYEARVQSQIQQYAKTTNIHDLPEIFSSWSEHYIGDGLEAVFNCRSMVDMYALSFIESAAAVPHRPVFLSIGCGDGTFELDVVRALHRRGLKEFDFFCLDLSDVLIARFQKKITTEFADNIHLLTADLNTHRFERPFDAVMANHSLHHMVDLERIFATIYDSLHENGIFVTNDMIGRNGHMRWPEVRLMIDFFWPLLSQEQRVQRQLQRHEAQFMDHDCSTEGFEGIRAQDILPLILSSGFRPRKFFGYGGFIDVFIDRGFGHGFSSTDPYDAFLIERISFLNDLLLDAGLIKPTVMAAQFTKRDVQEICYRGRTALGSIRDVQNDPAWLANALLDFRRSATAASFSFRNPSELLQTKILLLEAQIAEQKGMIDAIGRSTSWRVTAPLRALGSWVPKRSR